MKTGRIKILSVLVFACVILCYNQYHEYSDNKISRENKFVGVKKAIVIGASSGIGKAVAQELAAHGYEVGLTGRRVELLEAVKNGLPTKGYVKQMDLRDVTSSIRQLHELILEMGGLDLFVFNAAIGASDRTSSWEEQKALLDVNVIGFSAMTRVATDYFMQKKSGHIVGISSILALRGIVHSYTYSASKAFMSNYLDGLRDTFQVRDVSVCVTDIMPGFVDTDMTRNVKNKFWEASPEQAAQQIYHAIESKRTHVYVTKRWRLIAWFVRYAPDWLFVKIWK